MNLVIYINIIIYLFLLVGGFDVFPRKEVGIRLERDSWRSITTTVQPHIKWTREDVAYLSFLQTLKKKL